MGRRIGRHRGDSHGEARPLVAGLLFRTSPCDPLVISAVVLVLMASALIATLIPAWRATTVDPVTPLRAE
jgi:hypothetical protein